MMRVSWELAASTPRGVAPVALPMLLPSENSCNGGSCGSSFNEPIAIRRSEPVPVPQASTNLDGEVKELRVEVARLRAAAERDAKEKETLHSMVHRLKTELRHALDENRGLSDGLEAKKQLLEDQSAKREAAARETALNSAKELFKSMFDDTDSGRAGAENRNKNRKRAEASHQSQKRRPLAMTESSLVPLGTSIH
jgi:hypothetical protein